MRFSNGFIRTWRETPKDAQLTSHKLSLRSGIVQQISSGHYGILPLGFRVLNKIENIIRQEMEAMGAMEIRLPVMQPAELWKESGRWTVYGEEMFKLKNRKGHEYCLGPTHEELMVELVRSQMQESRRFPFTLYQFGTKFRDEKRPRGGLLRTREFVMKDAYSFDCDQVGLDQSYQNMRNAYLRVIARIGVRAVRVPAEAGEMGGQSSEEFIALTKSGENRFVIVEDGVGKMVGATENSSDVQTGVEICHIFKLGTRYSEKMNLFVNKTKGHNFVQMGCYGIGVSRMLAVIIEQHHDERGIIWPRSVAPFKTTIITVQEDNPEVRKVAEEIYQKLGPSNVLYDDRNENPGVKFTDADLIGIPDRLIVGPKGLAKGVVEYERRGGKKASLSVANVLEQYGRIGGEL
ncbi:MAG: aminoacyl--tRNA ligase-related protein [Nitrosomonas sp.]|nr:aminoacyl--tRNA ligase-related protein [Nitrosomonas sp.]